MARNNHVKKGFSQALMLVGLLLVSGEYTLASGYEEPDPSARFTAMNGPAQSLTELVEGPLGIVESYWWRMPLIISWYRLNDLPVPAAVRKYASSQYQNYGAPGDYRGVSETIQIWLDETGASNSTLHLSQWADAPMHNWYSFENCPIAAWDQALAALHLRRKLWGKQSPALQNWIAAQQQVFARCALGPGYFRDDLKPQYRANKNAKIAHIQAITEAPNDFPQDVLTLLRFDREYQIASARFYEGNYPQAAAAFRAISDKSPYAEWASYLALRAELRAIELIPPEALAGTPELSKLEKVIALQQWRTQRFTQLSADIAAALEAAQTEPERVRLASLRRLAKSRGNPAKQLAALDRALNSGGGNSDTNHPDMLNDFLYLHRQQNALAYSTGMYFAYQPQQVSIDDASMSNWLTSIINRADPADQSCSELDIGLREPCMQRGLALSAWAKYQANPKRRAWLYAAARFMTVDQPEHRAVLHALRSTKPEHPAYANFLFLQMQFVTANEGDAIAALLLGRPELEADFSARNRIRALQLARAQTLTAFWQAAPREILVNNSDADLLVRVPSPKPSAKLEMGLDSDAMQVLNRGLPMVLLLQTAADAAWPPALRRRVALMSFARAVLLAEVALARKSLTLLDTKRNPWKIKLAAIQDRQRFLFAAQTAIWDLGLQPVLSDSSGFNSCNYAETTNHAMSGIGPRIDANRIANQLLTAHQQQQRQSELQTLGKLPSWRTLYAQHLIEIAKANPNATDTPARLRRAVYLAKNEYCDRPAISQLSKQAFLLLHQRYKYSAATKRTPYWF
jgi:hypothetical protein